MKDNNKEQWIDSILESGRQLPVVEANPFMATRIAAKLQTAREVVAAAKVPTQWVYASALGMLLLLVLNVLAWNKPAKTHTAPGIQSVLQEYGFGGNNDLYGMNHSK